MLLFYDFEVVKGFSYDVVIRGELTRFYNAQLKYFNSEENSIQLEPTCADCVINEHVF